ncbi:hypothetical protein DENSPDRAFT_617296 [Dentipellis sp. KUC8613]|nr:hypothetical protein DENSPDRAFT_617296 [Dentipellis sp. KUC8613]
MGIGTISSTAIHRLALQPRPRGFLGAPVSRLWLSRHQRSDHRILAPLGAHADRHAPLRRHHEVAHDPVCMQIRRAADRVRGRLQVCVECRTGPARRHVRELCRGSAGRAGFFVFQ